MPTSITRENEAIGIDTMKAWLTQMAWVRPLIVEVPLFFLSIELIEIFLSKSELSLLAWRPDLYWIGIIIFGFVYGLRVGGATAIIAALIEVPWEAIVKLYGMEFTTALVHPFLMLAGGIAASLLASRDKHALLSYRQAAVEIANQVSDIEEDRQRLIEANLELEKKAVTREDTVLTLYSAAQNLSSLEIEKIYHNIPDLLIRYLNARTCSIYIYNNNQLNLVSEKAWSSPDQHPQVYDQNHGLFRLLIQKRRVLYPTDLDGVDEAVLVTPLLTKDKNLFGMLKIEEMTFADLHPNTVQTVQILSDWVMQAIENAHAYGSIAESQIHDELTNAYTFNYFQGRLVKEMNLSKRYHLDLSILFLRLDDFEQIPEDTQKTVLRVVHRVLEFQLRSDDLIARLREEDDGQFSVILPFTDAKGAAIAAERCANDINGYEFKPYEDEERILRLSWSIFETRDQSLYMHPIVIDYMSNNPEQRIDRLVERLLE